MKINKKFFEVVKLRIHSSIAIALYICSYPSMVRAQAINDAIAFSVGHMSSGIPASCLSLERKINPKAVERFNAEAETAFRAYLDIVKVNGDPTPAYKGHRPWMRWQLDGVKNPDLYSIRDPWASRIDRLEQIDLTLGAMDNYGRGVWRAYDASGALLGTYYIRLARKTKGHGVNWVDLWSPGQENRAPPLTPFCAVPGDHEEYIAVQEEAERERAERRAARAQKAQP